MNLFLVPLLPIAAGAVVVLAGDRSRAVLGSAAAAVLAGTLALSVVAALSNWSGGYAWAPGIALRAGLTPLSGAVLVLVPLIALPVLVFAAAHEARQGLGRLVGLLLVFTGGMHLLVAADDLLTLLIGWELVGACSWALIGHHWRDPANPRSATYAFVTTRIGDLGLFAALLAAWNGAGSLDYAALERLDGLHLALVAWGVLIAAAAKAGQVPFAPWLFRAMAGPSSVSALLHAAAMVAAGAYLVARLHPQIADAPGFAVGAMTIGIATALAGGLVAVLQGHAKKLLAASTSAHLGLMFLAVGTGYPGVAMLHLIAHAAFKAPLFLAAGIAGEKAGSYEMHRMRLGRALPALALAAGVAAAALAGVPPLGAAWTKEEVVKAAGHAAPWLAMLAIVAGGLSAAYATRFQLLAFGRDGEGGRGRMRRGELWPIAGLAALTVVLGLLWLPGMQGPVEKSLGATLPAGKAWEIVLSLIVVALGLLAGREMARLPLKYHWGPGAAWLGLPVLIDRAVVRPFTESADAAGRFDDRWLDGLPRGAVRAVFGLADSLAGLDRSAVDGGVRAVRRLTEWAARVAARIGEAVTDGLPEGAGRLAGIAGADARRLQTGLSHHYYALMAAGLAAMAALLAMGG
ncbi:proton-conducting transporter membrane subunit [Minwuia thermotolerans]|uniref:Proton-conducting membrane transporter n=1 Tax=Minwuia thermotolerans TaxID=2056226 RepID=A0A2M9G0K4_9PROT|nr:proton-conducting transporter membrane subunit [Minwuia thermotolerans]PJK29235.1 proton-conducting membrane transporter [Minwuia thermotolerans]